MHHYLTVSRIQDLLSLAILLSVYGAAGGGGTPLRRDRSTWKLTGINEIGGRQETRMPEEPMTHEVFFILDPAFAGDLGSLAERAHVWIVGSDRNLAAVQTAMKRRMTAVEPPYRGFTTITGSEENVEAFYRQLGTIDLHHGEYSAARPWDSIHVVGVALGDVEANLIGDELGDDVVLKKEPTGFVIQRAS